MPLDSTEAVDGRAGGDRLRWALEHLEGSAGALHSRDLPDPATRTISVLEVDHPALVLGSTQPEHHADGEALSAAGIELVRRRSGGGAVLLVPGQALWLDAVVPRGDPLWDDDVGRATHWLGATWARALAALGVAATVHTAGLVPSRWSSMVCFAGLGPGEVTAGGRKVVGIAQRRTRGGTRFQCIVLPRWDPATIIDLLRLDSGTKAEAVAQLGAVASGVDRPRHQVLDALVAALPDAEEWRVRE